MIRIWSLIGVMSFSLSQANMQKAQSEGLSLAEKLTKQTSFQQLSDTIKKDDLLPQKDKGKNFKSEDAKKDVLIGTPNNSLMHEMRPQQEYNIHPDDKMFGQKEKTPVTPTARDTKKICRESGKPYLIQVNRRLKVTTPTKKIKKCMGHDSPPYWEGIFGSPIPESEKKMKISTFKSQNPSVKSAELVEGLERNWPFRMYKIHYIHMDDSSSCHHYEYEKIPDTNPANFIKEWIPEDKTLFEKGMGPDCRIQGRRCTSNPKNIQFVGDDFKEGISVNSEDYFVDCWSDQMVFSCNPPLINECDKWRSQRCTETHQACELFSESGSCLRWKKIFDCSQKERQEMSHFDHQDLYCFDGKCIDTLQAQNNQNFGEVITKLSVFKEIKQDLEKTGAMDARSAKVFKGKCLQCQKNVCENLMYDCCGPMDGFTNAIHLSECSEEEKELAAKKAEGHCHYVGSKANQLLGALWTSSYTHSYCCFPSKFVRVLQEKSREQLKKGWGSAGSSNCGGLSMDEIQKIKFDTMDLSEAYEDQLKNLKEKNATDAHKSLGDPDTLKKRLEERIESMRKGLQE